MASESDTPRELAPADQQDATLLLIEAARAGDQRAIGELLQRYLPALRQFLRLRSDPTFRHKESVSDLVQTVCREVLEQIGKFEYRGENSFRNWLFGCALNRVRDQRRRFLSDKRDVRREVDGSLLGTDHDRLEAQYASLCTPSRQAAARERIERMEAAFDRLPAHYQEVILLARVQQIPHRDVAERMGRSEEATRQLLHRALVRLATYVDESD